jgi:hypothetical protein
VYLPKGERTLPSAVRMALSSVAESVQEMATRPASAALSMWRLARATPSSDVESNIRYLCIEIAPAAVLGAASSFNAAFAIRLGASNAEIGFLSSIPALLAVLVLIPSGRMLGRRTQRMPLIVWSLFLQRLVYLFIALVPFIARVPQGTIVVWLLIASTPTGQFFGVGWNSMLADAIPEARRARVFAIRSIVNATVVTVCIYLFGRMLSVIPFALNYQVMYVVGFLSALLSTYFCAKIRIPDAVLQPRPAREPMALKALLLQARQAMSEHHDFMRITTNTLMHGTGLWMIGPLYMLYFVRTLGASDGWIGLNGTLANLTPILGFYIWQRIVTTRGENRVLKSTIVLLGLYPLAVGLAPGLNAILVCTAVYGLISPAVNLSHFPMLLKVCPDDDRPLYIGIYSTIMNVGAFIMPLVGVYLSDLVGFAPMLVVGGVMCVLGSSSFIWNHLRTPDSMAARKG